MHTGTPETETKLAIAEAFTNAYREHAAHHRAVREAMCTKALFPALCAGIRPYDLIAGRKEHRPLAGFSIMALSDVANDRGLAGKYRAGVPLTAQDGVSYHRHGAFVGGYYCHHDLVRKAVAELPAGSEHRDRLNALSAFWRTEETRYIYGALVSEELRQNLGPAQSAYGYTDIFLRLACASLDYDKLLRLGLCGLEREIRRHKARVGADGGLYEGMLLMLAVVRDVCLHYEKEALAKAAAATDSKRKSELHRMAAALRRITVDPPGNLLEAAQLMWIYSLVCYMDNYGRMDVYLGDFYAGDIDSGTLTEEQALSVISSLWRLIADLSSEGKIGAAAQGRIITGGRGRRNESNADRFALAAMEVTRRMGVTEPNLTLRFYPGQAPALMEKALDLIGAGCIHPALYNDEVNVPAVCETYGASLPDAEQYIPVGCGEFAIEGKSLNSPNAKLNYLAALDLVLHNGRDARTGAQIGLACGERSAFRTFEGIVAAFKKQVGYTHRLMARRHAAELEAERRHGSFLLMSMLNGRCIERGRSIVDGGIDYNGGMIETYGLTNVADSLFAIRTLVYERGVMTLAQLVDMLDSDFEGHERERRAMLGLPKYGNDHEGVDTLLCALHEFVCADVLEAGRRAGLDYFTICSMNPGGYDMGRVTGASADGRKAFEPMAIGNAPTPGRDTQGLTALLNSMVKPRCMHGGYVQNLKVNREMFRGPNRRKLEQCLGTYFERGGCQLMITALNRADLEQAMREPEKHRNLMVRVGGWTSRYVSLPRDMQRAILQRTMYAA